MAPVDVGDETSDISFIVLKQIDSVPEISLLVALNWFTLKTIVSLTVQPPWETKTLIWSPSLKVIPDAVYVYELVEVKGPAIGEKVFVPEIALVKV